MALDKDRLGEAIATRIATLAPAPDAPVSANQLKEIWKAVADEIVKELTTNGVILPGSFANAAGPVAGTGMIQ